jgi:hypothetical protein
VLHITDAVAIKIHELDLEMKNDALLVNMTAEFNNPTVLGIELPSFHAGLHVKGNEFMKVHVNALQLGRGIQTVAVSAKMIPNSQDPRRLGDSVSELLNGLLGSANHSTEVGICGPLHLEGSEFIQFVTQPLALHLYIKDLFQSMAMNTEVLGYVKDHILPNITATLTLRPEVMEIPFSLGLPHWLSLPKDIILPFDMGISLIGPQSLDIVTFKASQMKLIDDSNTLIARAFVEIRPNHRPEAANELASMINPFFLSNEVTDE